jgi:hypothetical protein
MQNSYKSSTIRSYVYRCNFLPKTSDWILRNSHTDKRIDRPPILLNLSSANNATLVTIWQGKVTNTVGNRKSFFFLILRMI